MTRSSYAMPSLTDLNPHTVMSTGAHYGVNSDASTPIGLIALSRLARTKDASTLERMATSPLANALLTTLRALTLRVALAAGFDQGLSDANVATLFNLPGSSTKYQSQYGNFGSLQSRLPWQVPLGAPLATVQAPCDSTTRGSYNRTPTPTWVRARSTDAYYLPHCSLGRCWSGRHRRSCYRVGAADADPPPLW